MTASEYLEPLERGYRKESDPAKAAPMTAYMKNLFPYYGIKKPERAVIEKEFLKTNGLPGKDIYRDVVFETWNREEREWQYFGMELMKKCKRLWQEDEIEVFENLILSKSWWDTVDAIASHCVGGFFRGKPKAARKQARQWIDSGELWLQRTAIIFQLQYGDQTDKEWLDEAITRMAYSNEFFIRKAIGWALRQYSKYNPTWVQNRVSQGDLHSFSEREALKWLNRKANSD